MRLKFAATYTFFLAALALPALNWAKSSDADQPVHVEADTAQLNDVTGMGVYRGEVRITQGTMVLTADKVTLIAPGRNLRKVIARSGESGDKSTFRQLTDSGDVLTAESRYMVYEPDKNRITLIGNARLRRPPDRFAAARIVYNVVRQTVDAGGGQQGERVQMTLVPEDRGGPTSTAQ